MPINRAAKCRAEIARKVGPYRTDFDDLKEVLWARRGELDRVSWLVVLQFKEYEDDLVETLGRLLREIEVYEGNTGGLNVSS